MTKCKHDSTVLNVLGSAKTAALYFDYVVPLAVTADSFPLDDKIGLLIPPYLHGNNKDRPKNDDYRDVLQNWIGILAALKNKENEDALYTKIETYYETIQVFLQNRGLGSAPLLITSEETELTGSKQEEILLSLIDMPLINADKASWDHIMQFREDNEARKKLRRLKLFLIENYTGKDRRFIEDDLHQRLDDYKNVTKDWGFETITSTLSILLSSKSLAGVGGAALVSVLLGAPALAAAASVTGACIELGKISLHLAKRRYGLSTLRRDHPLSYLIEAKDTFDPTLSLSKNAYRRMP